VPDFSTQSPDDVAGKVLGFGLHWTVAPGFFLKEALLGPSYFLPLRPDGSLEVPPEVPQPLLGLRWSQGMARAALHPAPPLPPAPHPVLAPQLPPVPPAELTMPVIVE